jgi:DNA polymerase-3 subunit epsilon
LAEVYVELIGARQAQLGLAEGGNRHVDGAEGAIIIRERPEPLAPRLSEADIAAHREFVIGLGESAVWRDYRSNAG